MAQETKEGESELIRGHKETDKRKDENDWSEKIERAREARRLGQKLREGKPLGMGVYKTYGKGKA